MDAKKIVNFIFEMGGLRLVPRSGWYLAGVEQPESVATHVLRTAQIGYILAVMEGEDPEHIASIMVFHEGGETRLGDQNKVNARYISKGDAERRAVNDQCAGMDELGGRIVGLFEEIETRQTKAGIIAKDADWLETAFRAKEYLERGYSTAQDWIDNVEKALETESAKKLLAIMKETHSTDWWQGLKKMTYTKLNEGGGDAQSTDQSA